LAANLDSLLRRVATLAEDGFRDDQANARIVQALATVVLPGVLAVCAGFLPGTAGTSFWLLGAALLLVVAAQGWLVWVIGRRPQSTGPLLQALAGLDAQARRDAAALDIARRTAARLRQLQSWTIGLHAASSPAAELAPPLDETLDALLRPLADDATAFFGFSNADVWSLAVYVFDPAAGELRCVWRRTDPRHPSAGREARRWPPGLGHVGQTFLHPSGRRGLITPDATLPELAELLLGRDDRARAYDGAAYASFASFAFGPPRSRPYGVVIGTSSRVGAFDDEVSLPLRHASAVLSSLPPGLFPSDASFGWPVGDALR
jgi:hypothetical protein